MVLLPDPKSPRRRTLPLILLLAVAAFLRIILAFQPGIWGDEIFSLAMATGHSLEPPRMRRIPRSETTLSL